MKVFKILKKFTLLLYYFSLSCHTMRWQRSLLRRTFRSTTAEVQTCEMYTGAKSNGPPVVLCLHLHYSADPLDKIARWNEMLPALPRSLTSLSSKLAFLVLRARLLATVIESGWGGSSYPQVTRKLPESRRILVPKPRIQHATGETSPEIQNGGQCACC